MLKNGVTVVIGAGAMGRMHAELALRFSPRVLIISDLVTERLERVKQNIAEKAKEKGTKLVCLQPDKLDQVLRQESNHLGADDIVLAVGVNPVQQHALELLAPGGVANLFGGLPKGKHILELDAIKVHYQEIKIVGSSGGEPSDMAATLDSIAENHIDPGNYVAGIGSLDNAVDVLKMIKETKIDGKGILYPHIKHKPLEMVDYWSAHNEQKLLDEMLV
jgi:L-iditol 2-dehydrogenase